MIQMSVAEARKEFAEVINRASYARERTIISRHDQPVAAIISIDELRLLDALIERYEDEQDVADAKAALLEAHEDRVGWDAIKREFGI